MAPTDSDSQTVITLPNPPGPPDRYWAVGSPGAMVWGSARWGSGRWGNDPLIRGSAWRLSCRPPVPDGRAMPGARRQSHDAATEETRPR